MNWKYEAIDKLKQYEARRQSLDSIPAEIKRLEGEYSSIHSSSRNAIPSQGGGSRQEDALLSNILLREELAANLLDAQRLVQLVENALSVLDSEDQLLLSRFFIHRTRDAAKRLADELNIDTKTVYYRKDKALRRFTLAYYGRLES